MSRGGLAAVPVVAALVALVGCATGPRVHERYAELAPDRIAILALDNETGQDLRRIEFGNLLERAVRGAQVYDVEAIFVAATREQLAGRGYVVVEPNRHEAGFLDYREPLPATFPTQPFDAVLYSTIVDWSHQGHHPMRAAMRYRYEVRHVPSGELLFETTGRLEAGDENDSMNPGALERELRASIERTLRPLPGR